MDFIHRPKSKNIKKLKNQNHNVSEAGSASVLRWVEGEKGKHLLCWTRQTDPASITGQLMSANRTGVLLFSPSIHLRTEAEPASEMLRFYFLIFLIFYSSEDAKSP
jgi:hypothetical protein